MEPRASDGGPGEADDEELTEIEKMFLSAADLADEQRRVEMNSYLNQKAEEQKALALLDGMTPNQRYLKTYADDMNRKLEHDKRKLQHGKDTADFVEMRRAERRVGERAIEPEVKKPRRRPTEEELLEMIE